MGRCTREIANEILPLLLDRVGVIGGASELKERRVSKEAERIFVL